MESTLILAAASITLTQSSLESKHLFFFARNLLIEVRGSMLI